MNKLKKDYNVAPYNDDFSENNSYYRVMFVPDRAVQSRELTTLQTILQNQISNFGDHIFKDGSIVDGCNITYHSNIDYVCLKDTYINDNANTAMDSVLSGYIAVSRDTDVRANIWIVNRGYEKQFPDTNIFYVNYLKTGNNNGGEEVRTFQPNETIDIYTKEQNKLSDLNQEYFYNSINVISNNSGNNPIGQGYGVTVSEGVIYQKGFFVKNKKHTILVNKYDTNVDEYVVGFDTTESIATYLMDGSLREPANNSALDAPGADRLSLLPTLVARKKDDINSNSDFFPIIEFNEKQAVEQKSDPEYARLGEMLSRKTYEESGDYVVKPFTFETESDPEKVGLFDYKISPGIGYVKGNRIELVGVKRAKMNRATSSKVSNAEIISANYGSYILVNEISGFPDFSINEEIQFRDVFLNSVSNTTGTNTEVLGNVVGSAKVRSVEWSSGKKGTKDAIYRVYIYDLNINSSKSFAESKSISSNNYKARADIILEDNRAVVKEPSISSMVFPIGLNGVKRLTDSNGTVDTQYVFNDTSLTSLQSNGFATFTLNSPYAGGSERLNYSTGVISDTNELSIDIITQSNVYTKPLNGTVDTTGNNKILPTSNLSVDDLSGASHVLIEANNNSYVRYVTGQTANTLSINAPINVANTSAIVRKYWPNGSHIDLSTNNGTINVISNTQFSVSTGMGDLETTNQNVVATYPVLRSQAVPALKNVKRSIFVKIDPSENLTGPWNLGIADPLYMKGVYVGKEYSKNNPNRISSFYLNNGQKEQYYDHGQLVLKPNVEHFVDENSKILVELDIFVPNYNAGIGFFSVDSYPTYKPEEDVTSVPDKIRYDEIPTFNGIDLRNAIDFRRYKTNTANITNNVDNATVNPSITSSFSGNKVFGIQPNTNFQADIEYYLPRWDSIQMTKTGDIVVKFSESSLNPRKPIVENDVMEIGVAYVPPFPSLTQYEMETSGRSDLAIRSKITTNRGYTMRDINILDERIKRLEYYVTLSTLEQLAKDYSVQDENGLDRFKNGIFAEPFISHQYGKVQDNEYNIAIDENKSIARPKFTTTPVDLKVNNVETSNVQITGNRATLPYESVVYASQPFASKFRNCTENQWKWNGKVDLYPSYDMFRDEKFLPVSNIDIDMSSALIDFAKGPFGTQFGDWRTVNSNVVNQSKDSVSVSNNQGNSVSPSNKRILSSPTTIAINEGPTSTTTSTNTSVSNNTRTTTTTTTQTKIINEMNVQTLSSTYNMGSYVKDISMNPYMRAKSVSFIATGLKPNTRLYFFFDEVNVTDFVANGNINPEFYDDSKNTAKSDGGKQSDVVSRTSEFGVPVYSDSEGKVEGVFNIPENKFRVGDRKFLITNVDSLVTGNDAKITVASTVYTASSMSITTQDQNLNIEEPRFSFNTRPDTEVVTTVSTSPVPRPSPPRPSPPAPRPPSGPVIDHHSDGSYTVHNGGLTFEHDKNGKLSPISQMIFDNVGFDPISQSVLIDTPDTSTGLHSDKIGLYFKSKDNNLGVTVILTEVSKGNPDFTKVVATSYLNSSQISVSDDASLETVFEFKNMPFLNSDKYYAFMVKPDGDSPEYQIWCSEVGGKDITTGKQIFSNPYVGVLYVSANMNSWTTLQTEDIKFNLYRARFTETLGKIYLENEKDEYVIIDDIKYNGQDKGVSINHTVSLCNEDNSLKNSVTAKVQSLDFGKALLILDSSTGGFTEGSKIRIDNVEYENITSDSLQATSYVKEIRDISYSVVVPRIGMVSPALTNSFVSFKGMDKNYSVDQEYQEIELETEKEYLDKERIVSSYSNEKNNGNNKSIKFEVTLATYSDYVSPIINLNRKSALFITNEINNDITDENTRYGKAKAKYISENVVLKDGQDAEDMDLFVTAYRPVNTDVHVYVKFVNAEDSTPFEENHVWTKLDLVDGKAYSNPFDVDDYKEYKYKVPENMKYDGAAFLNKDNNGVIRYITKNGQIYDSYKAFCIKVVLTSDNSVKIPRLNDLRAIALQK